MLAALYILALTAPSLGTYTGLDYHLHNTVALQQWFDECRWPRIAHDDPEAD